MLLNSKEQGRGTFSSATWTLMSFSANMLATIFWLKCEGSVYLKSCLHPAVTLLALFWCRADFIIKSSCWKRDCCWLEKRSDKRLRGTIEILSSSPTIANSESLLLLFLTFGYFCREMSSAWASALPKSCVILIHSEKTATCLYDSNVIIRAKCQKCTNNDFTRGTKIS